MGAAAACWGTGKSIRGSGALREELALSLRLGVAPRRLQGWEPRTVTEFERDGSGNVVRAVEYREPEFDDEQRAWLLAFQRHDADVGSHGELLSEATSERAEPNYYGEGSIRYVANGPFTNQAEKAFRDAQDAYKRDAGENANLNGMFWTVEKKTY